MDTPEYSLENIPHPSYHCLPTSINGENSGFRQNISMEGFFYLDSCEGSDCTKKEVYNLKSENTPPNNKLLEPFEADLFKLIRKVKFRRDYNIFQKKLNKDIKEVKKF